MTRKSIFVLCALVFVNYLSFTMTESTICPQITSILSLLPKDKIDAILQDHLKNDTGFRSAIHYLKSKEWRDLVDSVAKKAEYQKFAKMAKKYDIDIAQVISNIRKHIDSLEVTTTPADKPNLGSFFTEIEAVIPINEIAHSLSAKLNTKAGQQLRAEIASNENKMLADDLYNLPELKKMRDILKGMNLDVEPYIALVYTFLGWV